MGDEDLYCYVPLPDKESIRLIALLPGKDDEKLQVIIHHTRINQVQDYEAVSYVWGSLDTPNKVYCSEKALPITHSLWTALRRFRLPSLARTLWIDQLCINQSDLEERNQQVRIMKDIFQGARRVLIWLGLDDQKLASEAVAFSQQLSTLRVTGQNIPEQISLYFPSDEALATCGLPPRSSLEWEALQHLCQLPYFDRIWVIQEVVVASDAVLVWGSVELDWRIFEDAILWMAINNCMLGGEGLKVEEKLIMFKHRHLNLRDCLTHTRKRQCTDPRDKVFAFLGIADIGILTDNPQELEVDYSKPVEKVFADFTRYCIRRSGRLDILNDVLPDNLISPSSWPSWIPQWIPVEGKYSMLDHIQNEQSFRACGDTKVSLQKLQDKDLFILEGLEVGNVEKTVILHSPGKTSYIKYDKSTAWSYISNRLPDPYMGTPLIRAFVNTLTAGMTLAPGYPLLIPVDESSILDYVARAYGEFLGYIRDELIDSDTPPTKCLRHDLEVAEKAFDFYQQTVAGRRPGSARPSKEPSEESCKWFRAVMEHCHGSNEDVISLGIQLMKKLFASNGDGNRFYGSYLHTGAETSFFVTSQGHMGLGPLSLRADDIICVMLGGPTPYALRPTESGEFVFLGECFLYGFVAGEAIAEWKAGKLTLKDFVIV